LNQDVSCITRLIIFFIRNQCDLFLFNIPGWWQIATTDPAIKLAVIFSTFFIRNCCLDLIFATQWCLKTTLNRFFFGINLTGLNVFKNFYPFTFLIFPNDSSSSYINGLIWDSIAIQISHNQVDFQGFVSLYKIFLAPQSYIYISGVNHQSRRPSPCLTIDIHHNCFSYNALWSGFFFGFKIHLEIMISTGISFSGKCLTWITGLEPPIITNGEIHSVSEPPGFPNSEGKI